LGDEDSMFRMIASRVLYNDKVGISLVGCSSPIIEDNIIDNNRGPGIKIGITNSATIVDNSIRFNTYGIEMTSCDPLIKHNIIEYSYKHGIFIKTVKPRVIGH